MEDVYIQLPKKSSREFNISCRPTRSTCLEPIQPRTKQFRQTPRAYACRHLLHTSLKYCPYADGSLQQTGVRPLFL